MKLVACASQLAVSPFATVVVSHSFVNETLLLGCLLNATGRTALIAPEALGLSVIWPSTAVAQLAGVDANGERAGLTGGNGELGWRYGDRTARSLRRKDEGLGCPVTFLAVRVVVNAVHVGRVDARQVQVDPMDLVAGRLVERLRCNFERHRRIDSAICADRTGAAVERVGRGGAVLLDDTLDRRGHERRLDLTRLPVGMCGHQQERRTGRMRARHRGTRDGLIVLPGGAAVYRSGERRIAGKDLNAGCSDVRLDEAPSGPRDENDAMTSPCAGTAVPAAHVAMTLVWP